MNRTFIITWEFTTGNVSLLQTLMQQYPSWCPIHANCWAILTSGQTADQIRNHLGQAIASSADRLFVIRSGTMAAWLNIVGDERNNQWLKQNL